MIAFSLWDKHKITFHLLDPAYFFDHFTHKLQLPGHTTEFKTLSDFMSLSLITLPTTSPVLGNLEFTYLTFKTLLKYSDLLQIYVITLYFIFPPYHIYVVIIAD